MQIPTVTLSLVLAALLTYAVPPLTDLFIYDRQLILGGQGWRLFTAPFVHFSLSHLGWNLLVLAAAGCATELSGYRRYGFLCILALCIPGCLYLALQPDLTQYGGLSALATGATAYFCLCRAQQTCRDRGLWIAIFFLLIVKLFIEGFIDAPLFAQPAEIPFRVLPSAHALGMAAAVIAFVSERRKMPTVIFARRSYDEIDRRGTPQPGNGLL